MLDRGVVVKKFLSLVAKVSEPVPRSCQHVCNVITLGPGSSPLTTVLRIEMYNVITYDTVSFAYDFVLELLTAKARVSRMRHVPVQAKRLSELDLSGSCLNYRWCQVIEATLAIVWTPNPCRIFRVRFVDGEICPFDRVHDHLSIEICHAD